MARPRRRVNNVLSAPPRATRVAKLPEIGEECFQGGPKLVLGLAGRAVIRKLRFGRGTKSGNNGFQVRHCGVRCSTRMDADCILLNANRS